MESLSVAAFLIVGIVIVGGFLFWQKQRVAQLSAEYANDPDVEIPAGWVLRMNTRPPHLPGHCVQAGGGKNNPPRWDIVTEAPRLAGRTSLSLSREGFSGGLREALGIKDIHTGDSAFDKAYTLRGSDADSVRGIVTQPAVNQAIHDLFNLQVWSFDVNKKGQITCRASRPGAMNASQAKDLLLAAVRLAQALNDHAESAPLAAPSKVA